MVDIFPISSKSSRTETSKHAEVHSPSGCYLITWFFKHVTQLRLKKFLEFEFRKLIALLFYSKGAFVWDQSGIRIIGIMRVSVCLGAIFIPEYLDFYSSYSAPRSRIAGINSGIYSYSGISQTNAPLITKYSDLLMFYKISYKKFFLRDPLSLRCPRSFASPRSLLDVWESDQTTLGTATKEEEEEEEEEERSMIYRITDFSVHVTCPVN